MDSKDYLKDISEIKDLMNKSSRFIPLHGLGAILAGIYAIAGGVLAYWLVSNTGNEYTFLEGKIFRLLLIDLVLVGVFSFLTAIILNRKKARKNNEKIWDSSTKRLLINYLTPLITGGIYIIIMLSQKNFEQVGALMLLFYGLALLNASKYSLGNAKYLGYIQIILGLCAAIFNQYTFWFWVLGFGIVHIVYGSIMYLKYDRNKSIS